MTDDSRSRGVLASPFQIAGLTLRNRFVLSPMAVLQPTADGRPSEQTIAFLTRRVRGGVGLVIVGGGIATARGYDEAPFHPIMRFDRDDFVPDLRRMVDAVHEAGSAIFAQLMPSFGAMGVPAPDRPTRAASPSGVRMGAPRLPRGLYVPGGRTMPPPTEISIAAIRELQDEVVAAARRSREAGFDGVEVAAHMRYLYSSFLSPRTNWRTDEYGGSVENRARILVDAVRAIRAEVGVDYPVGLRLSVNEHLPDGQGPEGFAEVTAVIAREGLGYVALTDGNYESMDANLPEHSGAMLDHGEPQIFRAALPGVPLLLSNTYDPEQAAAAIQAGHADAIMLARQLLADPDYPRKVLEGRLDEIVWCDHGNACLRRLMTNVPVHCHKNPEMGRESPTAPRSTARQDLFIRAAGSPLLMSIAGLAAKAAPKRRP